jgi:hypothetical protein
MSGYVRCDKCIFWAKSQLKFSDGDGDCRRFAPKETIQNGKAVWPVTKYNQGCGDGAIPYVCPFAALKSETEDK